MECEIKVQLSLNLDPRSLVVMLYVFGQVFLYSLCRRLGGPYVQPIHCAPMSSQTHPVKSAASLLADILPVIMFKREVAYIQKKKKRFQMKASALFQTLEID